MRRHLVTALLLLVLVILQIQLWWGRGSLPQVWALQRQIGDQTSANLVAHKRNAELANEVRDLQTGLDMVEEHARQTLGMVKPDELFIQFTPPAAAAAAQAPRGGGTSP